MLKYNRLAKYCSSIVLVIFLFSHCTSTIQLKDLHKGDMDYCTPNVFYNDTAVVPTSISPERIDQLEQQYHFSKHNIELAKLIGILPYLQSPIDETQKIQILSNINTLSQEIDAVASQLDCEGERADAFAHYVDNKNQAQVSHLTALSIIVGAATTIAAVAIQKGSIQNTVSIIGGVTTGGLGAMVINPKGVRLNWLHNQNILQDIWNEENVHHFFPSQLWNILSSKEFSNTPNTSLLSTIKKRWLEYIFEGEIDPAEEKLFFKNGGKYTSDQLQERANMLNQMQASIRSIHQDLASLSILVNQIR